MILDITNVYTNIPIDDIKDTVTTVINNNYTDEDIHLFTGTCSPGWTFGLPFRDS
jgi:hypothetical protein